MTLDKARHSPARVRLDPRSVTSTCESPDAHLVMSASPRFRDRKIHSWYKSVMAFPDHLVDSILESFAPSEGAVFFDPYCGSGTALVEAQRKGLRAFGLDANPSSVLASRVKTNWAIDPLAVKTAVDSLIRDAEVLEERRDDPIVLFLQDSGMIDRGWITYAVAARAAAVKRWIDRTMPSGQINQFFMLALITSIIRDLSNVKFGPELYCVPAPDDPPDVVASIIARLNAMVADLESCGTSKPIGQVRLGDARDGRTMRTTVNWGSAPAFVVTSPPYPTEHDYTRNSRLELVFMEAVAGVESLRRIKKRMIRSHSKGIYVNDRDAELVNGFKPVQELKKQIEDRIPRKSSGFEGQYPKVISNYFGGMLRHFLTLSKYLSVGSRLAYVVGDEASYKGVHIPTARLLAEMIDAYVTQLRIDRVALWRTRRKQRDRQPLNEHIILLRSE